MNPQRAERKWQKIGRAKLLEKSLFTAESKETKDYIFIKEDKKKRKHLNFGKKYFFDRESDLSRTSVSKIIKDQSGPITR